MDESDFRVRDVMVITHPTMEPVSLVLLMREALAQVHARVGDLERALEEMKGPQRGLAPADKPPGESERHE